MAAEKRKYVVTPTQALPKDHKPRIIEAVSQAAAVKFATKNFYDVVVLDVDTAIRLSGEGVKIESATSEE